MLVDQYGRPIKHEELTTERAAATLTGVRRAWHNPVANRLSPERLAHILESAAQGDAHDYLTLAEEMEERDAHYASVLSTRKHAVAGLERMVEAASDSARDVELADAVRALLQRPEAADLPEDLLDALGRSYSVVEIMWRKTARRWTPERYEWRDQRFFRFDRTTGRQLRLLDESNMVDGIELPPYKFLVHLPRLKTGLPIRGGLARLVAAAYMCKSYDVSDWMAFAEVFGMPLRLGRHGPQATEDEIRTLVRAVANLGTDAAAVVPDSMKIEFIDGKVTGGAEVFERLADWLDRQVSKAVVGQTMTADNGSSLAQAAVHNEVRKDLVRSDAAQLSATINAQLVRPFIDLNFGPQEVYPTVRYFLREQEDLKALAAGLAPFIDRGMRVEASVIRDKFGLPDPAEGAELLVPLRASQQPANAPPAEQPARNRTALNTQTRSTDTIDELVAEEMADWVQIMDPIIAPVRDAVNAATTPAELEAALPAILERMMTGRFTERLALRLFEARALGDVKDRP